MRASRDEAGHLFDSSSRVGSRACLGYKTARCRYQFGCMAGAALICSEDGKVDEYWLVLVLGSVAANTRAADERRPFGIHRRDDLSASRAEREGSQIPRPPSNNSQPCSACVLLSGSAVSTRSDSGPAVTGRATSM